MEMQNVANGLAGVSVGGAIIGNWLAPVMQYLALFAVVVSIAAGLSSLWLNRLRIKHELKRKKDE